MHYPSWSLFRFGLIITAPIAVLIAYLLFSLLAHHHPAAMSFRLATTPLLSFFSTLLPPSIARTNASSFLVPVAGSLLQKPFFLSTTPSSTHPAARFSQKTFSTTSLTMASTLSFSDAIAHRRTIYNLTKESTISDDRLKEIVTQTILDVPSSFNSQSSRLIVLVKEKHDQYWQIVEDALRAIVPADSWASTEGRIKMFKNAYGTILFYEDREVVKGLQTKLPIYADKFPQWSEHTSAMHQYALWVALEAEGLGANLQHYNPLPDQKVSEQFGVPLEWSHVAQLVFGKPAEGAREGLQKKDQKAVEERVQWHGF